MNPKLAVVLAKGEKEVVEETRFTHLHKQGFVRGASAQDQWMLFVNEAWEKSRFPPNENVKDYLAFMLCRFVNRADLFEHMESFDCYLHLLGRTRPTERDLMNHADACLLYAAFFRERSLYRHQPRTLERVTEMGIGFYDQLAQLSIGKDDCFSCMYRDMATSFCIATMVLRGANPAFAPFPRDTRAGEPHDSRYVLTKGTAIALELCRALEKENIRLFEQSNLQGPRYN